MTSVKINGVDVPCNAVDPTIDIPAIISSFRPFREWVESVDDKFTIKKIQF
jgi:hypothetical protein